jgi:hypothetical protein
MIQQRRGGCEMETQTMAHRHIAITETLVRLYVFLEQHMDRSLDATARLAYPEHELQAHLASARAEMMEILSVNQVVKAKVEEECNRVVALTSECLEDGADQAGATYELRAQRAVLKNKTVALSDLLAVFRAA